MKLFSINRTATLNDFERIFFNREYQALSGRNYSTLYALITILFITILALSFAMGAWASLEKKMSNPYTNWVNLPVGGDYITEKITAIQNRYSDQSIASSLDIKHVKRFCEYAMDFHHQQFSLFDHPKDTLSNTFWGRTIDSGEPLLEEILNPMKKNLIWILPGLTPSNLPDCGLIVSERLLSELGYENPAEVEYLCVAEDNNLIFFRIVAVVRELPGGSFFLSSIKPYNILMAKKDGQMNCYDLLITNQANQYFLITEESNEYVIDSLVQVFFFKNIGTIYREEEQAFVFGAKKHIGLTLAFLPSESPRPDSVNLFITWVNGNLNIPLATHTKIECGGSRCNSIHYSYNQNLSFHFNRLNYVRDFRKDMWDTFEIEIDLSQIAEKENFAKVSRITFVAAFVLSVFSILSIVFFVNNLLRTHLFKVRANLGTFQAFGLDKRLLIRIYLKIIFSFLAIAAAIAFGMGVLIDCMEHAWNRNESQIDVFNGWILAAIIGLFMVSLLLSTRTIRQLLEDTPGNLIYER